MAEKNTALSKEWKEFADAWISFLDNPSRESKERLNKAIEIYPGNEHGTTHEDWVKQTKIIMGRVDNHDRDAWRAIYNYIVGRYLNYDYPEKILEIAKSKGIGESVWKI